MSVGMPPVTAVMPSALGKEERCCGARYRNRKGVEFERKELAHHARAA